MNSKHLIKSIYGYIPEPVKNRTIRPVVNMIRNFIWRERTVSYGNENEDKTFYVIRFRFLGGIFGLMAHFIPQIEYAIRKGYIPVIDMQNHENMYLDNDLIGKVNAWEYYFEQPAGFGLDDICKSKKVILGNGGRSVSKENSSSRLIYDREKLTKWHELFSKYVRENDSTKRYCDEQYHNLVGEGDTVLGVLCRGTDYTNNKPHNHPVQPDTQQIIEKAGEFKRKYNCNKVFLATEDKTIWDAFKTAFGDELVTNDRVLLENTGNTYLPFIENKRKNGAYLNGLEYIATIDILSRLPYLVAGNCGGSLAAMYMTEGFSDAYIFDLGLYE